MTYKIDMDDRDVLTLRNALVYKRDRTPRGLTLRESALLVRCEAHVRDNPLPVEMVKEKRFWVFYRDLVKFPPMASRFRVAADHRFGFPTRKEAKKAAKRLRARGQPGRETEIRETDFKYPAKPL